MYSQQINYYFCNGVVIIITINAYTWISPSPKVESE